MTSLRARLPSPGRCLDWRCFACLRVARADADPETGVDFSFAGPTCLWSKALRDTGYHALSVQALRSQGLDDDVIWKQVGNKCLRLADRNAETQLALLQRFKVSAVDRNPHRHPLTLPSPSPQTTTTTRHHKLQPATRTPQPATRNPQPATRNRYRQPPPFQVGYLQGTASLTAEPGVLSVTHSADGATGTLSATNVLLATGSSATRMAGIPFDGSRVHDSDSINGLGFLPTSVVITGSGVIAIEYAQIFRKLGAEVTMLVRGKCADGLARVGIDVDVARMLIQSMRDGEECERSAASGCS